MDRDSRFFEFFDWTDTFDQPITEETLRDFAEGWTEEEILETLQDLQQ